MEEMNFPVLVDEPSSPQVTPAEWMAANEAMRRLIPEALRRQAVEASSPVPVRFTLTDDDQDAKPA